MTQDQSITAIHYRLRTAWAWLRGRTVYAVVTPDLQVARLFLTSEDAERWTRSKGRRFWNASQTVRLNGREVQS